MSPAPVLLTGAAGGVGTVLRERLPELGHPLRLFDRVPVPGAPEAVTADLADGPALRGALRGCSAVVHLAGIPVESSFETVLRANVEGTWRLYEAARAEGVRRVVYASSNHAVGFTPRPADGSGAIGTDTAHRPDTFYGLSKCFGEDLAQLYWDRHGVETVSLRIGSCRERPDDVRSLSTWLSPDDCARLVHAALTAPDVGHTVAYGSSANTRLWWDLGPSRALGYDPVDDSERFAPGLLARHGPLRPGDPATDRLGGRFCVDPPMYEGS